MQNLLPAATASPSQEDAVTRVIALYEQLSPDSLARLDRCYAADARFKDPFNEVQGLAAIAGIFEHMFRALQAPRFIVTGRVVQGEQAFLTWEFRFRFRRGEAGEQCVRGASHLLFSPQGLIVQHRDYWDAAEELYEKLPLLGPLMRWLRRRAGGR